TVQSHLRTWHYNLVLSVDGSVVTGATIIPGKEDLCAALLGKVLNKFDGGQILMNWFAKKFDKLSMDWIEELCLATEPDKLSIGGYLLLLLVGQLKDVEYEGTVKSVREGGNAGIRQGGAAVKLEVTNSTATARLERIAQGGHAWEERREFVRDA
ncbi:hypothetical protein Goshw_000918, partial [Gossypium schwendimanii]|nr:hypothetical protein [Gossypium schwendimanii]